MVGLADGIAWLRGLPSVPLGEVPQSADGTRAWVFPARRTTGRLHPARPDRAVRRRSANAPQRTPAHGRHGRCAAGPGRRPARPPARRRPGPRRRPAAAARGTLARDRRARGRQPAAVHRKHGDRHAAADRPRTARAADRRRWHRQERDRARRDPRAAQPGRSLRAGADRATPRRSSRDRGPARGARGARAHHRVGGRGRRAARPAVPRALRRLRHRRWHGCAPAATR